MSTGKLIAKETPDRGVQDVPIYSFGIIQFDDVSPGFTTTDTVGNSVVGDTYTIASGADFITLTVEDDDVEFDDGFIDPPGNSTGANNQLIAEPVTVNGVDYGPATSGGTPQDQVELEFAFTTTDGDTFYVVRIDGVNVGLTGGGTLPQPGQSFTIDTVADGQDEVYGDIPCFAEGTRILTASGPVPVEELEAGDLIVTMDDGLQRLVRITRTNISTAALRDCPWLRPIVFEPGAIGNQRVLRLSPQHRVLISGWRAELFFGETQVLVPAKALVDGRSVRVGAPNEMVRYHHLLLPRHHIIFSEGAPTESLLPGRERAYASSVDHLAELIALDAHDPALAQTKPGLARRVISAREARVLNTARHRRMSGFQAPRFDI